MKTKNSFEFFHEFKEFFRLIFHKNCVTIVNSQNSNPTIVIVNLLKTVILFKLRKVKKERKKEWGKNEREGERRKQKEKCREEDKKGGERERGSDYQSDRGEG